MRKYTILNNIFSIKVTNPNYVGCYSKSSPSYSATYGTNSVCLTFCQNQGMPYTLTYKFDLLTNLFKMLY